MITCWSGTEPPTGRDGKELLVGERGEDDQDMTDVRDRLKGMDRDRGGKIGERTEGLATHIGSNPESATIRKMKIVRDRLMDRKTKILTIM